jgi:hypothetical protein
MRHVTSNIIKNDVIMMYDCGPLTASRESRADHLCSLSRRN